MSGAALAVVRHRLASKARLGDMVYVVFEPDRRFRAYEGTVSRGLEKLSPPFDLAQALRVAEAVLAGDPVALADERYRTLLAAAVVALYAPKPEVEEMVSLSGPPPLELSA